MTTNESMIAIGVGILYLIGGLVVAIKCDFFDPEEYSDGGWVVENTERVLAFLFVVVVWGVLGAVDIFRLSISIIFGETDNVNIEK